MRIDILSLFPEYFRGPFDVSMLKRAQESQLVDIRLIDLRTFGEGKHRRVDDRPFGGGPGMVLKPGPAIEGIRSVRTAHAHVINLSPQGTKLTAAKCEALAQHAHLILLCGQYEGIDERIIDKEVDEQVSIGDYVLTNGCLAAIVLVDATVRFIPGVLGHPDAADQDSFQTPLLDHPQYTRPRVFEGSEVPAVLTSGDHAQIAQWRLERAKENTLKRRPDLNFND